MKDLVIYELHVKGISENFPLLPEGLKGRFKGLGNAKIIEYFKSLGINAIEIMPCAAWIDEDHLRKLGLSNYWGYNSIGFLSPDPKLAPDGWEEIQECVSTFEAAGIETIIDVVFNHTGEGDKFGPQSLIAALIIKAIMQLMIMAI